MRPTRSNLRLLAVSLAAALSLGGVRTVLGSCGPFTDFTDPTFCPFVLEIFTLGITTGTTPTTYDPAGNVTRLQMAAFLSRTVDGVVRRINRRGALAQFWTNTGGVNLNLTTVASHPIYAMSDGSDVWVSENPSGTISRVRASDGRRLETWTGAADAVGILPAVGRVYATGYESPNSKLYVIDPSQPAGAVTTVATNLGQNANALVFDGSRIWSANTDFGGSVSIVTPAATTPWTVTTVTAGFVQLWGAAYDGAHVWVTDYGAAKLFKLDASGAVLQTVTVGVGPQTPVFDGGNIWVPNNFSSSVSVVRASSGAIVATLTGNGLSGPAAAAFDGERILITNFSGDGVSLFKAADLTPIGNFTAGGGTTPYGACSDGINFWFTLYDSGKLARF